VPKIHLSYQWLPDGGDRSAPTSPLHHPLMDLLQAVRDSGSISMAAKSLGLSYRHVWGELKRWEQMLTQPLIVWEKGQAARLTEFADKLLWAERQAQARLAPQISALQAELEKTFALAFDPGSHVLTMYASHDDALVGLREHAAGQGLHLDMRFCGSVDAIRALNEGRCTVAGFHAPMQPAFDSLVARTYRPLLATGQHKLIGFAVRQQGLMVAPGNPLNLRHWQDLLRPEVRFVNRTLGTGTRLLLDNWLSSQQLAGSAIQGYAHEESSHAAVAACVASGRADCALGIESAARAHHLDFVPLLHEHYWLVCLKSALDTPAVQHLLTLLQAPAWSGLLGQLPGYVCEEQPGRVHSLKRSLPWWQ
jgi:putative molybdopterin biosynthesis protein